VPHLEKLSKKERNIEAISRCLVLARLLMAHAAPLRGKRHHRSSSLSLDLFGRVWMELRLLVAKLNMDSRIHIAAGGGHVAATRICRAANLLLYDENKASMPA
jgi:hypothetical protein